MVSTRHHPKDFNSEKSRTSPSPTSKTVRRWVHTPSASMTIWLLISVPLVLWDAGYVLLRPHSMPGGKLHSPIWTPYALYGTIDYIYGWPAFNARNGFTAAQTVMNLVETAGYIYYLYIVYTYGVSTKDSGRGIKRKGISGLQWLLKSQKMVSGHEGAIALLIAYSTSLMTFSKTVLYCEPSSACTDSSLLSTLTYTRA